MSSPYIHEVIAGQRQADWRREAHRERLAAIAAARGPGKLARLGSVLASVRTGAGGSRDASLQSAEAARPALSS